MKVEKAVGNADDFVADEEESEDEMIMTVSPKQKPAIVRGERKKEAQPPKVEMEDDDDVAMVNNDVDVDDNDNEDAMPKAKPTVYGAMDDYAQVKETKNDDSGATTNKRRRRRKKLVEVTAMDASGYLTTETKEVWEDIPSDEEDPVVPPPPTAASAKVPPPASRPKKKPVQKSKLKQGNLMGFFTKKT
jgi:hypothetical protein